MRTAIAFGLLLGCVMTLWVSVGIVASQPPQARRGPRVIELEEIRIEGRVQKPNAFYILNRSNLGYEVMDLRTSFVREVVRTVQREPF